MRIYDTEAEAVQAMKVDASGWKCFFSTPYYDDQKQAVLLKSMMSLAPSPADSVAEVLVRMDTSVVRVDEDYERLCRDRVRMVCGGTK